MPQVLTETDRLEIARKERDRWEIARKAIEHEDNLVNHRLSWFLLINGFLFAAAGAALGSLSNAKDARFQWAVFAFLILVSILGLIVSWTISASLRAAYRHVGVLETWWSLDSDQANEFGVADYPPITGAVDRDGPFGESIPEQNPYRGLDDRFWEYHQRKLKPDKSCPDPEKRIKSGGTRHQSSFLGAEKFPRWLFSFWLVALAGLVAWALWFNGASPTEEPVVLKLSGSEGRGSFEIEHRGSELSMNDRLARWRTNQAALVSTNHSQPGQNSGRDAVPAGGNAR